MRVTWLLLLPGLALSAPVDFSVTIEPLFQKHCIDCHAADEPDGEFNMESFAAMMKGGKAGKAIVPGNAQDSLLVKFLEGRSGKEGKNQFMPPGKREHLSAENIAIIRQWIDTGALPGMTHPKATDALANLPKISPQTGLKRAVQALAFSAKAGLIASGSHGSVHLLKAENQEVVRKLEGIAGKVNALVFSADGTMLFAAAGDPGMSGIAYQWKVGDGSLVRKFSGHVDALYAMALSPDGRLLATGSYDQKIKLWSLETGEETALLKGHNGGVFGVAFRPDGKVLASASADRTVKLWEVPGGRRLDTFSQPLKEQMTVAFSPDGKTLAAGGADNRIRIWSVSEGGLEGSNKLLATRFAHEGALLNLAYTTDGSGIISTAADKTVKIWKASDLTERLLLERQSDWAPALTLLEGGKFLLGRLDGSLVSYDLASGKSTEQDAEKPAAVAPAKKPVAPAKPELIRLIPRGVQSGSATKVKVIGKHLQGLQSVKSGRLALNAKILSVNPEGTAVELEVTAEQSLGRIPVEISLVTPAGETMKQKLYVDDLPQQAVNQAQAIKLPALPVNLWGILSEVGQLDSYQFSLKKGETVTLDLMAKRLESKATSPRLELLDVSGKVLAFNNGLDSGSDPFLAYTATEDMELTARVREITLQGSPDHAYRLTVGMLPYVTGWWPLSVRAQQETEVKLVGHNLKSATVTVKADAAESEVVLPLNTEIYRTRVGTQVKISNLPQQLEVEPNETLPQALALSFPAEAHGLLQVPGDGDAADVDLYRFSAKQGQAFIIETRAAMAGSPVDTKLEVLDAKGEVVPMLQMQATKDSWLALRSTDANAGGIRLGQFSEMELNDYMFFNGEVLKIYQLARGPDADMIFYTKGKKRKAFFNTSPAGHGLDEACYVVEPRPMGAKLFATGLPVFTLLYANDDAGDRDLGKDSRLNFTAPAEGTYYARVSDTRGWSGERFAYSLTLREPTPDFNVNLVAAEKLHVPQGTGVQFAVSVDRRDGWEGAVNVEISGVPDGFFISSPLVVEAGHEAAAGSFFARLNAEVGKQDLSKVNVTATGVVQGQKVTKALKPFAEVQVTPAPKKLIYMESDLAGKPAGDGKNAPEKPFEITISPGESVSAWLRVDRRGDDNLIALDVENLPHGIIVDNIGLSGVQIRAGEDEREIFLACAKWVQEQDRLCHVVVGSARNDGAATEGAQTGFPVLLKVRKKAAEVTRN
jgi:sugar lactone lactonase YvrE